MFPRGAALSPTRPRQDRRDSAVSAELLGGVGRSIIPDPPTESPYPPNGPSKTGGTQMYAPLCGEELEVQKHLTPPWGISIPQTAKATRERLGCIHRLVGRGWKVNHTQAPHGAPLFPKGPGQERRDSGVCAVLWGGVHIIHGPPMGVLITHTAHTAPEGLGRIRRCVWRIWKLKRAWSPHGVSLCAKRPKQARRDLGV